MKNYIKFLLLFLGLLSFSCNDYLDVQPDDKYLNQQVFSSPKSIENVLNGIYLKLTTADLYGGQLTMSTLEVIGQRYNLGYYTNNYFLAQYSFKRTDTKQPFNKIWSDAYAIILNINNLINQLKSQKVLSQAEVKLITGEAYGLRAMLHFDLLRLFGPVYATNSSKPSIPYYIKPSAQSSPLLKADKVIKNILSDLTIAETMLKQDPIVKKGVDGDPNNSFYQDRNLRMNFYAVKALQARVNLYAGNKQNALNAAQFVIEQTQAILPWTNPEDITSSQNPDRVFSSEIIFAIDNPQLYEQQAKLFSSDLSIDVILAPNSSRLSETFESNENDYRFNSTWKRSSSNDKNYRTMYKFADVEDKSKKFRFMQPLIRKTEMYYIAAETITDKKAALDYINTVRLNRGLKNLLMTADIEKEIEKEYKKEFYGEGQLFFYYKRKNLKQIPNGLGIYSWQIINMSEDQYVIPLPELESKVNN